MSAAELQQDFIYGHEKCNFIAFSQVTKYSSPLIRFQLFENIKPILNFQTSKKTQ